MAAPRLLDQDPSEFRPLVCSWGESAFRGDQLATWVYRHGVLDPERMGNLPRRLRERLAAHFDLRPSEATWSIDRGSTTEKVLLRFPDGEMVESVLIMEGERTTACLSSQVGCPVACRFCASGTEGLRRNLTRGEVLEQFYAVRARAGEHGRRLGNIVMMGMGDPMLNIERVLDALRLINAPEAGGIGARHITISSVGLRKGVERLRAERKPYVLALSLHAPNDELRRELVPFEGALGVEEAVDVARTWLHETGREVTFEYVLLDGVNDRPEHQAELAQVLRDVRGTVNLIPYNENPGLPFRRPAPARIDRFAAGLRASGLKVTVRKQKGDPILAACGQLRLQAKRP